MVAGLGDPKKNESVEPTGTGGDDGGADAGLDVDAGPDAGEPGPGSPLQAMAVAMSPTHGCAIVNDAPSSPENGTIRCWGDNGAGQLGNAPTAAAMSSTPIEVAGRGTAELNGANALALASGYSCTVAAGGYLLCWGDIPVGTGVTRVEPTPAYEPSQMDIDVRPIAGVASASMTDVGGCVTLAADQSLLCWGQDLAPSTPDGGVTVLDGGIVVGDEFDTVAVGRAHACGIAATSSSATRDVECWGANNRGQSGLPASPLAVSQPHHLGLGAKGNLLSVATGGDVSCALFENGTLYCWGANDHGQLGTGTAGADSSQPQQVVFPPGAGAVSAVAVGDGHACAVLDTSVWCWGDNGASQLGGGPGGPIYSAVPGKVQKATGSHVLGEVNGIAAGGQTTCTILLSDPRVWCWGANDSRQAGQPSGNEVSFATPVAW
jgi:alpha-tubulin suppressor-like RCC1 family protein